MKKIFIADDDFLVRMYFKQMIDWRAHGFELCGEAKNGQEALARMTEQRPDILLTDISMPVMDGIELIRQIKAKAWDMHIFVFSCHDDFDYEKEAMKLGIDDYLLKNDLTPEVLLQALGSMEGEPDSEGVVVLEQGSDKREVMSWQTVENSDKKVWENFVAGLHLEHHGVMAMLLNIPHWKERRELLGDSDSLTLQQSFKDMCEQAVASGEFAGSLKLLGVMHSSVDEKFWGVFLDYGAFADQVKMHSCSQRIAARLEQLSKRYFNLELEVYLSSTLQGAGELPIAWNSLVEQLKVLEESKPEGLRRKLEVSHPAILHSLQYIDEHYQEDLSLTMVAESVSLNPAYFSTLFKKEVGSGFSTYISSLRLEAICKRLLSGNEKIKEIALSEGFFDYQYFCRLFHRTFGMSPSEYRKNS